MKILLDIVFVFFVLVVVDSLTAFAGTQILWNAIMKKIAKILNIPIDENDKLWMFKGVTVKKDAPVKTKKLFRLVEILLLVPVILWVIFLCVIIYINW